MERVEDVEGSSHKSAYFERVIIPDGQSFLWRMDDFPWRRSVWNYHPEFEIHLIRHSSGLCYIGDYIGGFGPGHLVLVGSNLPHNWITPQVGDARLLARDIVVQFDATNFTRTAEILPEFAAVDGLFNRAVHGLEFLGETARIGAQMLEAMGQRSGLGQLAQLVDLLALMAGSREHRTLATPDFVDRFRPGTPAELQLLDRALDFIQKQFRDSPGLSDVAHFVGMSDSAFSRFFKTHTGNTFSDHLTTLRIWTARQLLSESERPVTEVCFEAGFSNISNFNRTFLNQTQMTPSQYRRASKARSLPDQFVLSQTNETPGSNI